MKAKGCTSNRIVCSTMKLLWRIRSVSSVSLSLSLSMTLTCCATCQIELCWHTSTNKRRQMEETPFWAGGELSRIFHTATSFGWCLDHAYDDRLEWCQIQTQARRSCKMSLHPSKSQQAPLYADSSRCRDDSSAEESHHPDWSNSAQTGSAQSMRRISAALE